MSIVVKSGDLFESNADVLVNAVNTVGTMGAGIAKEFKRRYPAMFAEYGKLCRKKMIRVGEVWIWPNPDPQPLCIINLPTKDHWNNPSKLEWIASGLANLCEYDIVDKIASIAMPALGCGFGGLQFDDVRKIVEETMGDLDVQVMLYEPQ